MRRGWRPMCRVRTKLIVELQAKMIRTVRRRTVESESRCDVADAPQRDGIAALTRSVSRYRFRSLQIVDDLITIQHSNRREIDSRGSFLSGCPRLQRVRAEPR